MFGSLIMWVRRSMLVVFRDRFVSDESGIIEDS